MIIGFAGRKGVGKTTAANYLRRIHGFTVLSFSSKLKCLSGILIPTFTNKHLSGPEKETPLDFISGHTAREFMERFGEFMRFWDKDYWISGIKSESWDNQNIAIDDVRYPNEVDFIRGLGGKLVKINRYDRLNIYPKDEISSSENSLTECKFDYVIEDLCNVTLLDLFNSVDDVISKIKEG